MSAPSRPADVVDRDQLERLAPEAVDRTDRLIQVDLMGHICVF